MDAWREFLLIYLGDRDNGLTPFRMRIHSLQIHFEILIIHQEKQNEKNVLSTNIQTHVF